MHVTPASLLFRLRSSEETSAWTKFVDLYTPLLFHWAEKLGQQESDRADLVQDVFLILWRKLPEFEYDSGRSFHAWLKTIFLNRYRSRLRKREAMTCAAADLLQFDINVTDVSLQLAEEEERRFLIRQAFRLIESEFSVQQQQVFREYVLNEQPPDQVAKNLGISPGAVYGIKSRILSRLREELRQILD